MKLFLDCEFNEFKGDLISMALVSEDGNYEWYEVVPCENPGPWVKEHVMPILGKPAISVQEMQRSLQHFLAQFDKVHIIADWPEDIKHFCDALIVGAGMRIDTPPLTMEVVRIDFGESKIPHNALCDARGIRDLYLYIIKLESNMNERQLSDEETKNLCSKIDELKLQPYRDDVEDGFGELYYDIDGKKYRMIYDSNFDWFLDIVYEGNYD